MSEAVSDSMSGGQLHWRTVNLVTYLRTVIDEA
jgi:hypothetical protein